MAPEARRIGASKAKRRAGVAAVATSVPPAMTRRPVQRVSLVPTVKSSAASKNTIIGTWVPTKANGQIVRR